MRARLRAVLCSLSRVSGPRDAPSWARILTVSWPLFSPSELAVEGGKGGGVVPLAHIWRRSVFRRPLQVKNGRALRCGVGEVAAEHVEKKGHRAISLPHQGLTAPHHVSVEEDVGYFTLRLCFMQVVKWPSRGLLFNRVQRSKLSKPAEGGVLDWSNVQQGRVVRCEVHI